MNRKDGAFMKFELIDENKIKIEITKDDLVERDMKIVELAYGSDKAKEFFHEVMELAYEELGFDVNNVPILVEAVPVSLEEISIFVTKVTNPDELETKLSQMPQENIIKDKRNIDIDTLRKKLEEAKENIFKDMTKKPDMPKSAEDINKVVEKSEKEFKPNIIIFSFKNIDTVSFATKRIPSQIDFKSSLVQSDDRFYLTLEANKNEDELLNVENFLYEYGDKHISTLESKHYLIEHGEVIIKNDAIKILSDLYGY